ncbi:hypothetical protein N0V90_001720 [Kalmusia sp. IMI 367209]|nr:hypothetical protein N0V90_001720 [Kalmusia sp. IMI 367209]
MAFINWTYKFSDLLVLPIILICSRLLFYRIYNRYFHPLAHIPGPFFGRMSPWPSALHAWKGDRHLWLEHCFNKYGDKVRVAPDTVLFRNTTAYRDIYGNRSNVRRADFYDALKREENQYSTITYMDNASHTKSRRLLDLAFTNRSLRASADFMQQHIDRWHELLTRDSGDDWTPSFNFTDRVNFLVFDILGDICYGNSFKTMEPLMTVLYAIAKSPFLHLVIYLRPRGLSRIFKAIRPKQIVVFDDFVEASIAQRIEREKRSGISGEARQDMFHFIYNAKDSETGEAAFRDERLVAECRLLVIAGSDSTSVTLSGLFFYLSHYTTALDRLRREITNTFHIPDDIAPGPKLSSCKYLRAAIDEAMRMSPAGLSELPRQVLPGGTEIDGEHFPENTIVGTAAWCDGFNDEVYGDAAVYRPERWLVGDTNSAEDIARIRANFHPFSIGPHNCAGTNFALQELMLVVAKTVHRFDIRLASEWVKGAGMVQYCSFEEGMADASEGNWENEATRQSFHSVRSLEQSFSSGVNLHKYKRDMHLPGSVKPRCLEFEQPSVTFFCNIHIKYQSSIPHGTLNIKQQAIRTMRILCLHGHGSSSTVFKAQTATIRHELGKDHTYDFVQGTLLADMAPGLEYISNPDSPHFAYYKIDSPSSFIDALKQLEEYIIAEGPFDGVMAFSQGAGLAAMHITRSQLEGRVPPFKFAVLIASNDVYDPTAWLQRGVVQPLDTQIHGRPIKVPTVVVWGEQDPWKDRSERTMGLCEKDKVFVVRHAGGHDVPGLAAKEAVHEVVKMIRRVIIMAGEV